MTAYPSPEKALRQAGGDRAAARHLIRAAIMAGAERQVAQAGCSGKCTVEQHADEPYGCKNDGSTCICYCHDGDDAAAAGEAL